MAVSLSLFFNSECVFVGMVFFKAGLLKYNSFEFAVKLFEDEYKVPILAPAVAARLAMFNELTYRSSSLPVLQHASQRCRCSE